MSNTTTPGRSVRWRWAVVVALLIVVDVLLLVGFQRGECVDYIANGPPGACTAGPAPEAWFIVVVSLVGMAYCARRLVRSSRP